MGSLDSLGVDAAMGAMKAQVEALEGKLEKERQRYKDLQEDLSDAQAISSSSSLLLFFSSSLLLFLLLLFFSSSLFFPSRICRMRNIGRKTRIISNIFLCSVSPSFLIFLFLFYLLNSSSFFFLLPTGESRCFRITAKRCRGKQANNTQISHLKCVHIVSRHHLVCLSKYIEKFAEAMINMKVLLNIC